MVNAAERVDFRNDRRPRAKPDGDFGIGINQSDESLSSELPPYWDIEL